MNNLPVNFGLDETPKNAKDFRGHIDAIEQLMFDEEEQIDFEKLTRHYFSDGLYCREITIPPGTLLTGKIHTTEHINIISKGDISVMTENGIERVVAPATLISKPGTKRIGFTHAETVWTTIHANPTNEKDLTKLEARLISPTHEAFELTEKQKELLCHG